MSSNTSSSSAFAPEMPDLSSGVFTDTPSRDVAVSVRGLSKSYSIAKNAAQHSTAGEAIMHKLKNPFAKTERDTFWALSDVNFDIQKGDVVGIIGRNGAGKSTLLKVLSRITEPTRGRIDLYGRVGSLLEVGTGFHPELTGRENIFLNGAILGMQKSEIARQFDAIVDFSGTEQFLDTPVKRYSSGMYVRLAFAVAAHLNPEILIVDEVLAVGDAEFQKKCLGKMQDVAQNEGKTVIFVSHNLQAVKSLCNRVIFLQQGKVAADCETEAGLRQYLVGHNTLASEQVWDDPDTQPGDDLFRLMAVRVLDEKKQLATTFYSSRPILVEFEFDLTSAHDSLCIGFDLNTEDGTCAFRSYQTDVNQEYLPVLTPGKNRLICCIDSDLLNAGTYTVDVKVSIHNYKWIAVVERAAQFDVLFDHGTSSFLKTSTRPGPFAPIFRWTSGGNLNRFSGELPGVSEDNYAHSF